MSEQKNNSPQLTVLSQYIKDISFENPAAPAGLQPGEQPELGMNFDLSANQLAKDAFEVVLTFDIEAAKGEQKLFLVEIKYAGLFRIVEENKQLLEQILLIQCPTLLFPYVRQIVADITSKGGFPPVNINPIDFYNFYLSKKQESEVAENSDVPTPNTHVQ